MQYRLLYTSVFIMHFRLNLPEQLTNIVGCQQFAVVGFVKVSNGMQCLDYKVASEISC